MKSILSKYKVFKIILSISILISIVFFNSCDTNNLVTNPPPFVEFVKAPAENSTLYTEAVSFSWQGSTNDYQFRYRMLTLDKDNFPTVYLTWTKYSNITEAVFPQLNDSKYKFEVQGKSSGIEARPITRTFTVDSFVGPAFTFFKTETNMNLDDTASIGIWMEDIDSLSAATIVVSFDNSILQLLNVSQGIIASKNRLSQLIVPDFSQQNILSEVNSTGKITISTAVLKEIGSLNTSSISGSGLLLNLLFKAIQTGQTVLQITSADVRKINGAKINTNPPKDGFVNVK